MFHVSKVINIRKGKKNAMRLLFFLIKSQKYIIFDDAENSTTSESHVPRTSQMAPAQQKGRT